MTPRTYLDLPLLSQYSIDKCSSSSDIYADAKITKLSGRCVMAIWSDKSQVFFGLGY